jgi:hypothetical protein
LDGVEVWTDPISEKGVRFLGSRFEAMRMKRKSLLFLVIVWLLSLGGIVQAQQEKKQGEMTGKGQSSSEYQPYMGGKEHYMVDSPNYMAGKRQYLQGDPFPDNGKIIQRNEPVSVSKGEMAPGERKESDDQGGAQIQININVIPEDTTKGYGIIYLPVLHPKHDRGAGNFPPHADSNPPQTGNFKPRENGGFHQGTINLR